MRKDEQATAAIKNGPMYTDGTVIASRIGGQRPILADLYHFFQTARWRSLFAVITLFYLFVNAIFALGYLSLGPCIANTREGSFADAFFFSVQTLATIGYGTFHPTCTAGNALVTAEALVGLFLTAGATGIVFAKFSRPTARVLFSRVALIAKREGAPTLTFRMGNERSNQIVEATVHVTLARDEVTSDGEKVRRLYDLPLVRATTPMFQLSWSVYHRIEGQSILLGATPESLRASSAALIVTVMGIDDTLAQMVHARHAYNATDIIWNARFVDILAVRPDGIRTVDYGRFHDYELL